MYKAEILADSLSPQGDRLITMKITFPRFILAEFNTHRMFSRNSASSRAIPFNKMVKMVEENPFIPIAWQKDHKGMQGTEYITGSLADANESDWLLARNNAITVAKSIAYNDTTKQLCNRLLEPFMWHTVIVTATEWENFFKLRCPEYEQRGEIFRSKKDSVKHFKEIYNSRLGLPTNEIEWLKINKSQAEIHIQAIAELMWDAMNESTPKELKPNEWHIPFGDNMDFDVLASNYGKDVAYDMMIKIATARCARISYETLGDNPKIDYEADIKLHDVLVQNGHASPLEHCARVMSEEEYESFYNGQLSKGIEYFHPYDEEQGWCRNFRGFIQYRHIVETN